MIFEVYLDDKLLYYPNDETYVITNSKVELALNEAGSFEFDIPKSNLRYDDFNLRKSMISVKQNDIEIFYGEVREVTDNFDFTRHVYAVGELAFLFDSIQPQCKYQCTPTQMLTEVLNKHNAQVEDRKKYQLGYVSVTDPNDYIYRYTNREDTLTVLRDKLCDTLDGYLRIRKVNGIRYLDLVPLANYGQYCKQEIQFGENLLDYSCNTSAADIATSVIPLGARLENEDRTANAVDGLDEYLSIAGCAVNDYHKTADDDFVQLDSAIATFGNVRVVKQWDDVTVADNLMDKAIEWLKSAQYESMTLELNALDMNLLDVNIDSFDVGDTIHAWALPYGMDTTFPVQKKTIYLNDLSKNSISLGSTVQKSYTKQASDAVSQVADEIPETSPILQSAKLNALNMLNGSVGGHVIMKFDSTNSYVEEIQICNAAKESISTQKWVWNLNGLGFMYRSNINDAWKDLSVAITMDGHIVADYITSGKLTLAGNGSTATLDIYNGNERIGYWDSTGIYAKKGTFAGDLSAAGGTFAGDLSAAGGTFKGNLSAAGGSFSGNLSAAGGTFKGNLSAVTGTITDGSGTLSLKGGNLYMTLNSGNGPALFAEGPSQLYSCWGCKITASRNGSAYREVETMEILKVASNESDARLKKNINDLDLDLSKKLIMKINPKTFEFLSEPNELHFGVIAQDIRSIEDELNIDTENNRLCYMNEATGLYSVDYTQLIAPMIKVMQSQQDEINELKSEINKLKMKGDYI